MANYYWKLLIWREGTVIKNDENIFEVNNIYL